MGTCRVSPDNRFLAYTLDITGNEKFVLQIKDLRRNFVLSNHRVEGVVSLAWAQDGCTLFYTLCDQNHRPYRQIPIHVSLALGLISLCSLTYMFCY